MRSIDFSSLHALLTTVLSLAVITLLGVGIRLLTMATIQGRHERMNRQINERLRALIAAYKTLGGSFTGDLSVDPSHLRDAHRQAVPSPTTPAPPLDLSDTNARGTDRTRRIRDAVEAALSDIILLGTEQQVRLAAHAAQELANGKLVHTEDLVLSLRTFIREALDLDPIPADIVIPQQGPARPSASGSKDKSDKQDGKQAGGGGGGMGGGGISGGFGFTTGSPRNSADEEDATDGASDHA